MNDQVTPQSMEEFKKVGRQTLYRAIAGGLIAGVVAAGGILWSYVSSLSGDLGLVPNGAIVAYDLDKGCPRGWKDISEIDRKRFAGRVIIAAGPRVDRGGDGTTLERKFRDQGGEEQHVLTIPEIPSHNHPISTGYDDQIHDGLGGSPAHFGIQSTFDPNAPTKPSFNPSVLNEMIGRTGKGKPHNNMPPFIALYYCKKG